MLHAHVSMKMMCVHGIDHWCGIIVESTKAYYSP